MTWFDESRFLSLRVWFLTNMILKTNGSNWQKMVLQLIADWHPWNVFEWWYKLTCFGIHSDSWVTGLLQTGEQDEPDIARGNFSTNRWNVSQEYGKLHFSRILAGIISGWSFSWSTKRTATPEIWGNVEEQVARKASALSVHHAETLGWDVLIHIFKTRRTETSGVSRTAVPRFYLVNGGPKAGFARLSQKLGGWW